MKPCICYLLLILLIACKKEDTSTGNEKLIKGKKWLTVQRLKNGVPDPAFVNEISTTEFRNDGKMYLIQEAPFILLDTANYQFIDNENIHIDKPWATNIVNINCKIKLLTATRCDFTLTSPAYPDTYEYSTVPK